MFIPFAKPLSFNAFFNPLLASFSRYGNVCFVNACVEVLATLPGMFVMQHSIFPYSLNIGSSCVVGLDSSVQPP